MKLIIDIPEDKYDLIQMAVMSGMGDYLHKAVAQGIPLDEIRTKIEEAQTYDGIYIDRDYIFEIIDKA